MEKVFACITNGVVENTIVADEAFVASYANGAGARFDAFVRVDELAPRPGIGWAYADGEFTEPVIQPE